MAATCSAFGFDLATKPEMIGLREHLGLITFPHGGTDDQVSQHFYLPGPRISTQPKPAIQPAIEPDGASGLWQAKLPDSIECIRVIFESVFQSAR
jgi:hypothetical protein